MGCEVRERWRGGRKGKERMELVQSFNMYSEGREKEREREGGNRSRGRKENKQRERME